MCVPFRRLEFIVHIAISVLQGINLWSIWGWRTHIETMSQDWEGRNMIFLWKFCTKRGFENARQAATSAKHHALAVVPCPSPNGSMTNTAQLSYLGNVIRLSSIISETGNPFMEDSTDLLVLDAKGIADLAWLTSWGHTTWGSNTYMRRQIRRLVYTLNMPQ